MDLATFAQLLGPVGRSALTAATDLGPTVATYPALADRLGKHFPAALARAALDTVLLRAKARAKFTRADAMFFTREALEMATGEVVARHRAGRFAGFAAVADLGCGVGGDAIGLAAGGRGVRAVDSDPVLVRMAEANLAAYGLRAEFAVSDVLTDPLPAADAAFADPGRRPGGRRRLSVDDSEPPLPALLARLPAGHPFGVKAAPGIPRADLGRFDAEAEFVSVGGELKECGLWFGPLQTARRRATVLPGGQTLAAAGEPPGMGYGGVRAYLYDPDPAVDRAGLVGLLADRLGAEGIDPEVAFLTADTLTPTPFATAYRVEEVLPADAKRVGAWLRARSVGRVTIVKRGALADAEAMAARLKLHGDGHRAVILTRAGGRSAAVLAERVS